MAATHRKICHILVLGDSIVLLIFSLAGWFFHQIQGDWFWQVARIGAPFAVGYFASAFLAGALARDTDGRRFARKSLVAWLYGITLSLLLRTILEGRVPILSFVVVTIVFTALTLLGWRTVYWLVRERNRSSSQEISPTVGN